MINNFPDAAKQLLNALNESTAALVALLQQEYDVLKKRDTAELIDLTSEKQALVDLLDILNKDWLDCLKSANIEISINGIRQALEAADAQTQLGLASQWQHLSENAKACQRQNTINGTVLELRHHTTQFALDILNGSPANNTYGPTGKTSNDGNNNPLAKV